MAAFSRVRLAALACLVVTQCSNGQTGSIRSGEQPPGGILGPCPERVRAIGFDQRVNVAVAHETSGRELEALLSRLLAQPLLLRWNSLPARLGDNPVPLEISGLVLRDIEVDEEFADSDFPVGACTGRKLLATASFELQTTDNLFSADVTAALAIMDPWSGTTPPQAVAWNGGGISLEGSLAPHFDPALISLLWWTPDPSSSYAPEALGFHLGVSGWRDVPVSDPVSALPAVGGSFGASGGSALATIESSGPEPRVYAAPAAFSSACERAEPTSAPRFATRADFIAAIAKPWLRCSGHTIVAPSDDGIEFRSDGSWRHLAVLDGAPVAQLGFAHEGRWDLAEGYAAGSYELTIHYDGGLATMAEGVTRELSASGNTLRFASQGDGSEFIYVASDRPPQELPALYADGTRAGSQACSSPQTHVRQQFASIDELRSRMLGPWQLCGAPSFGASVDTTAIVFEADGHVRYVDGNYQDVFVSQFQIDPVSANGPPAFAVSWNGPDARYFIRPWISDAPVTLWANDGAVRTLLAAE